MPKYKVDLGRISNCVALIEPNNREDERNVTIYGMSAHVFGNNKCL